MSTRPANLQIPASIGEVVDKITILEPKAARLSGERQINAKPGSIKKQANKRLDPVQNG
ncbi:hypothetical protein OGCDGJMD_01968 [Cyanobium usitatum str. Tous]|nr:hypothetical protein OGCDGJMD_01968 [Cyanobium usitatum str. Tous]